MEWMGMSAETDRWENRKIMKIIKLIFDSVFSSFLISTNIFSFFNFAINVQKNERKNYYKYSMNTYLISNISWLIKMFKLSIDGAFPVS